jgi:Xaa-Pro aminopeptidase
MSEYVADAYKRREYVSGFDGSAGTVLIDHHSAHLLTDARYWQQANTQLDTNVYTLIREGHPADPSLYQLLDNINCTAIQADPTTISTATAKTILGHGISIQSLYDNPIDRVWAEHRPKLPTHPLHILHTQFAGVTLTQKVETLRGKLEQQHALVISALDEIACKYSDKANDMMLMFIFRAIQSQRSRCQL